VPDDYPESELSMTIQAHPFRDETAAPRPRDRATVEWRSRYDGLVAVAYVDGKAVAGISGPWSDKFALTWWERPLPQRQLELFDSLDDAKHEVEGWALRVRNGYATASDANVPALLPMLVPVAKRGLLDQIRTLLPEFTRRPHRAETPERPGERRAQSDVDLSGLHFAADK